MKISRGGRFDRVDTANGYGYATDRMYNSLTRLGYEHALNDKSADVEIWFDQPHHWTWSGDQYRVGYHPWESTQIHPQWFKPMKNCDEIWTPSPIVADWYRNIGLKSVYVYEHGVDPIWTIKHRPVDDKIRFLHVGGEALRKGGLQGGKPNVITAFREAFGDRTDVELTLKMNMPGMNLDLPDENINVITKNLSLTDLIALYHDHHVFVYPSWGEGFGLNPLQAMSTGMPVICTGAWAPYERLLDPDLNINSWLVDSPWPKIHPGKIFHPDFEQLVDVMRHAVDNYETVLADAVPRALAVRSEYNWDSLTAKAFGALEWRLFSQGKLPNPPGL